MTTASAGRRFRQAVAQEHPLQIVSSGSSVPLSPIGEHPGTLISQLRSSMHGGS